MQNVIHLKSCKLEINRVVMEQVISFTYLWTNISSERNLIKEAQRIYKVARISSSLRDIFWKNKNMKVEHKIKLYLSIIRQTIHMYQKRGLRQWKQNSKREQQR